VDRNTPHHVVENPTVRIVTDWMRKFARAGSEDLDLRALVEDICKNVVQGDYAGECLACYYWVCQNVRYMRDIHEVEFVKQPERLIETLSGDCDDIATLLAAMFMSCGNKVRFVLVGFSPGGPPSHVFVEVLTARGNITFDPVANRDTANMLKRVATRIEVPV